jgi:hypothetical protein
MKRAFIFTLLALFVPLLAYALPPIATEFYGYVFAHNGSAATAGTYIRAYDSANNLCGAFNVSAAGYYGLLSCTGDDSSTNADEGPTNLENISFTIDGGNAYRVGNYQWAEAEYHYVNLTRNEPPVIQPISDQMVGANQTFTLQVIASDADNDTLIYYDDTALFIINSTTGFISFLSTEANIGSYIITITVSDGFLNVSASFSLTIVAVPFCGDGLCDANASETCQTCPADCGQCPPAPPTQQPGAGGGGGGGAAQAVPSGGGAAAKKKCTEQWICAEWGNCTIQNLKFRTCEDSNKCDTNENKPNETEACEYIGSCFDGIQNNGETGIDCGGLCLPCPLRVSCYDGIQNQDEEEIDCGGPCPPCTKPPAVEKPKGKIGCGDGVCIPGEECSCLKDCRRFPFWFVIIMSLIIVALIMLDQIYIKFVPRSKIIQYKKTRRKLYLTVINLIAITILTTLFLYFFGSCLRRFWWILLIIIIATPIALYRILRYYEYNEKRKRREQLKLLELHERRIRELIKSENRFFYDSEQKVCRLTYDATVRKEFENRIVLYQEIRKFYSMLVTLYKIHGASLKPPQIEATTLEIIKELIETKALENISKEYPEFNAAAEDLSLVYEKNLAHKEAVETENTLIGDVKEMAADKQLMIVISANSMLTKIYNKLVDVYAHFKSKHERLALEEQQEMDTEKRFSIDFEKMITEAEIMTEIKANQIFIIIYNALFDLNSHYKKRAALYQRILEIRRTKEAQLAISEKQKA